MPKKRIISLAVSLLTLIGTNAFGQNYSEEEVQALSKVMSRNSVACSLLSEEAYHHHLAVQKSDWPTVQRFIDWVKLYHELRILDDSQIGMHQLPGAVTSFFVSYPFEGTSMFDFARPFSPEKGYDTSKVPEGLMPPAMSWMSYQSTGNLSAILPHERINIQGSATIFLATRIEIDSQGPVHAYLEIPSSSPIVAWMNGKRVLEFIENGASSAPLYGTRWPVELQPGENILTIKTAQLDNAPEFYVFLTDSKTNEPLQFKINLETPIVSDSLSEERPKDSYPSILETISKDDKLSTAVRAFAAREYLSQNEDTSRVNDLLMNDLDATAALSADDIELAIIQLDPAKSLQILKKALPRFKDDPRMELLYARQMILSALNQGDFITRFIDEWPQLQKTLTEMKAPVVNGISYEPLRQQLLALAELTIKQPVKAYSNIESAIGQCIDCTQILNSFPLSALIDAKLLSHYRQSLDIIKEHDQNSSALIVEIHDQKLRKASADDSNEALARELADIQKETERFFQIHPYDEIYWDFWLRVLTYFGVDTPMVQTDSSLQLKLASAGFTAEAETWFIYYISQRSNDPHRWMRYAEYCLHSNRIPDAISAYEMALTLQPEDETIAERIQAIKTLSDAGNIEKATAAANTEAAFEAPYIIKDVPANSDKDAIELVTLLDNRVVRVLPNGLTSTFYQLTFEILDDKGLKTLRAMPIQYSPSDEKVEIISVTTTKKDGSVRRLFKTSEYDLSDESIKMYYDKKALLVEIQDLAVGDRVEFQFKRTQLQHDSSSIQFFSDIWQLQNGYNRQWMRYTVIAPESMNIHMLRHNPGNSPQTVGNSVKENGNIITSYEEKNMPRFLAEKMQPGPTSLMPFLLISTFNSWQELANWYIDLSAQQWKADDAIRAKVTELTNGISDPFEKLKRVHSFVVKNTRYVALEFGIHGHKPYPAAQIFERRFGDCKDKASLLKVMLKEAGIDSEFVLARTRMNGDITTELASPYLFDHAILYVPQFDLFLDGTAEFSGTNELPAMDQAGQAFILNDDSSYKLRKIPVSLAQDNTSILSWDVDLTDSETIHYNFFTQLHGYNAPNYRQHFQSESLQRETLEQSAVYGVPGSKLESFEFSDLTDLEKDVTLKLSASVSFKDVVKVNGNTWLIYPQIVESDMVSSITSGSKRRTPIIRPVPSTIQKTISYTLPQNAEVTLPDDVSETTSFGHYTISARKDGNKLTTSSTLIINQIEIQPDEYSNYLDFLQRFDRRLNTRYQVTIKN